MAFASSLLSEEQFLCSICLEVFTDPITIPCGHSYCKACITRYWDTNDVCQCPLCQKQFIKRQEFSVNRIISEMVDQLRKSKPLKTYYITNQEEPATSPNSSTDKEPDREPDADLESPVTCDVCTPPKLQALKSCVVCLASYCETHLEPHQRVTAFKRHKLIDPLKNPADVVCKKHERALELFCKTDHVCVCQFCAESDHESHQIVSLKEEYERKKAQLGKTEAEIQRMIQERHLKVQEVKYAVELSRKDADREILASVQVFSALISCIERSQAELIDVLLEKQKTTASQAEGFIIELQREITELKKRSSELKQLSHTEDHLHLIQNFPSISTPPPTKDWTNVSVPPSSYAGTVKTAVARLEKTLSKEMDEKLIEAELRRIQQYAVDVTLDPDTAHRDITLSEDGKQASHGNVKKYLPENKERFTKYPCVLGKQSYSGRFYYEVEVKGKTDWDLGVARESVDRKGLSLSPDDGYWTIHLRNGNKYMAAFGSAALPVREKLQKVGVFVDHEEGLISFYDVEARVHLYSFTGCTFTDNLYPYFGPCANYCGENSTPLIISAVNQTD